MSAALGASVSRGAQAHSENVLSSLEVGNVAEGE